MPPLLSSVQPGSGPSQGGTPVTLLGTDFEPAVQVLFDGQPATDIIVIDGRTLTCTTPAGTGVATVQVEGVGGASAISDAFVYGVPPIIDSIEPASGPSAGGLEVRIAGSQFGASLLGVTFDGVPAEDLVVTDTLLVCTTPAGLPGTTVDVEVTGLDGTAELTQAFRYTIPPTVTAVTPGSLFDAGLPELTVQGAGFLEPEAGTPQVRVGELFLEALEVSSDSELRGVLPPGSAGQAWDVEVLNQNGSAVLPQALTSFSFPPSVQAEENRLDDDGIGVFGPVIQSQGSRVHLAWSHSTDVQRDVYYRRSEDHGSTWGDPSTLSTNAAPIAVETLAMTCDGPTLTVGWVEAPVSASDQREIWVRTSPDGGASWPDPPQRLDVVAEQDSSQLQLASFGGVLFVLWQERFHIALAFSSDVGTTWSEPVALSDEALPHNASAPVIDGDAASIHVAWNHRPGNGEPNEIRVRSADLGGLPAFAPALTLSGSEDAEQAAIAIWAGSVFVGFCEDQSLYLNRSNDGGVTWLPAPQLLQFNVGTIQGLQLLAPESGLCAFWRDSNLAFQVACSSDTLTWKPGGFPAPSSGNQHGSARLVAYGDHLAVAFSEGSQARLNLSLDAGLTWLTESPRLDTSTLPSVPTSLAFEDARLHVVWSGNGLWYNRNSP